MYIKYSTTHKAGIIMDILKSIIEIDKTAAAEAEKLVEAEMHRLDEADEKYAGRRERLLAEERAKADEALKKQAELLAEKKRNTKAALVESTEHLDGVFAAHRSEWQNEIISRITGV